MSKEILVSPEQCELMRQDLWVDVFKDQIKDSLLGFDNLAETRKNLRECAKVADVAVEMFNKRFGGE